MAKSKSNKDLLARIRERYKVMAEADQRNRREAQADMRFALVPGEQWDPNQKKDRGDRPCYEFNKIRVTGKRIVNDMRANRPQGKVRAVEDGDKAAAEALEGICRNIWHVSDGDTVIDYAAEYQVFGGMGAWRIVVDYASDDVFEQEIRIEAIRNPFCLFADPAASDPIKRDATDWILTERIAKSEYERKWPKADVIEFEGNEFDDDQDWEDENSVRICEYWYREPVQKRIALLSDGQTVNMDELTPEQQQAMAAAGVSIVRERTAQSWDIYMCIASGEAILEGPTKFVGRQFPFVVVYGEWVVIDGKPQWCGITRFAKDAQRSYNVARTSITETIAAAPQAKYLVTPKQITGLEQQWAVAHKENMPFLPYNNDPSVPPPQRMGGADVPVALIQESQLASEEIKSVTGIFDASLGKQSNETTGIAIRARQAQGEIATFNYADNMAKGIKRSWEIILDIAPKVYDTQRTVRVLGVDGAEKYLNINGQNPQTGEVIDITRGKYDVAITTGPGFSTQREMAAEIYTQLAQANPAVFPIAGDLIFKAMDLPYSDKMAERMKAMLPPQIQQMESDGKPIPPEAQAVMMQAQQALQMAEQQSQLVQQAAAEVEQGKAEADKAKSEVQMAISDLEVKRAQFEAQVAKQMAALQVQEANMAQAQTDQGAANDRESLALEVKDAVTEINKLAAQFMQQASQTLAEIQARSAPQIVVPPKPRILGIQKKGPGMFVPVYEDQVQQVAP